MKDLKDLNPVLHINFTDFLIQNAKEAHLNVFKKVVELRYENDIISIIVMFNLVLAGKGKKRFNLTYIKSAVNWKAEVFEVFSNKRYSISQHKLIDHVEWLLNES